MTKREIAMKLLVHHIKSVNKYLTDEWIGKQDTLTLLNCAHPMYRKEHAKHFGLESYYN